LTSRWPESAGIDENLAEELRASGRELERRAEPGFAEFSTHEYLAARFESLGFTVRTFGGIPGFAAESAGGGPRTPVRTIALVADMDGLPDPGSPEGAYIHSCGHHMQTTALYGAARILADRGSEALEHLSFIAAPAEEYIDFESREELRRAGVIRHLSGKQELLARGEFEGFRRVVSTHAAGFSDPLFVSSVLGMGGFEVMRITFTGKSSHAGAHPHKGINAQNAAALFLHACAFLRESFDESAHIRIHPVLTLPVGQSVNIIPGSASVETYVRAASPEAISLTAGKLSAAAEGCARAIGASTNVSVTRGYAPFTADREMHQLLKSTAEEMGIPFIEEDYSAASSDMGDVSQAIPSVMLGLPGVNGLFHNPLFRVTDETAAYVLPAAVLARYLETLVQNAGPVTG
jgi:amidohydrolase